MVEFSHAEFCTALGLTRGRETYRLIQDGLRECATSEIIIDDADKWRIFHWLDMAEIDKRTNQITVKFSSGLGAYLGELKKMYARIELMDLGKLQSLYAIRLFELAKSYESLAGKEGNTKNCWYFVRSIQELRTLFGIEPDEYVKTNDFRRFVLERPAKEVNEAGLGLIIDLDYERRGRILTGVKFCCEKGIKKAKPVKKRVKKPAPVDVRAADEAEGERLKAQYPEEYAALYAAAEAEQVDKYGKVISPEGAAAAALTGLRQRGP
jgi:plasmid replication initiation protein